MRVGEKHSQHEILLPAWLTASHSDGRALNILHLQGHVCVKFLCRENGVRMSLVMFLFIPNSVILFSNNKKTVWECGRYPGDTTHLVVHQAWLSSLKACGENE